MYKLLLINPRSKLNATGLGISKASSNTPLALAYLAALTPNNFSIKIIDENIELLRFLNVDLVAITSYTAQINRAYEIALGFRSRNIPVIMGGIHVSMEPDEALQYCSSVVIGEAENVWANVLEDFTNGCLQAKYEGPPADMNDLPIPDRSLFPPGKYLWGSIITSKGCPMDCSFCSVTRFNGQTFRRRPVENVINELSAIKNRFIWILDDNLLGYGDKEWLLEFFNQIISRKIKKYFFAQVSMAFGEDFELVRLAHKAGIRLVVVGIESINTESLRNYNKKLNLHYVEREDYLKKISTIRHGGVAVLGCFILGGDSDVLHSFKATLSFIQNSHIDVLQISKPTPLPGTRFYQELDDDNRIIDKNYPAAWKDYRFTRMLYKPKQLSIKDVYEGIHYIKTIYYSLPQRLKRLFHTLLDTRSVTSAFVALLYDNTYRKAWAKSEIYKEFDKLNTKKKFES